MAAAFPWSDKPMKMEDSWMSLVVTGIGQVRLIVEPMTEASLEAAMHETAGSVASQRSP